MKKLIPARTKYKKYHKGYCYNRPFKCIDSFRFFKSRTVSLKILVGGRISSNQIESIRFTISKIMKKFGVLRINAFSLLPISKKPVETRMGKGKGAVDHWVFCAQPGFVFCDLFTKKLSLGSLALKIAQGKLPLKTKLVIF